MEWILWVWISSYVATTLHTERFVSEAACKKAGDAIISAWNGQVRAGGREQVVQALCVRDR